MIEFESIESRRARGQFTRMLVYCDDPSHTADPVGPVITAETVLPDDVEIVDEFTFPGAYWPVWVSKTYTYRGNEDHLRWDSRSHWEKRCRRCGQRGGRWGDDLDAVLTQLAGQGITGIRLRELDLRKHGGR